MEVYIMPKNTNNVTDQEVFDPEAHEKEAQINALRQLLNNTQAQVYAALEGELTLDEYNALKAQRKAWRDELVELLGEATEPTGEPLTPDVVQAAVAMAQLDDTVEFVAGLKEGLGI